MFKDNLKYFLAIVGVILGWVMIVPTFEFPDEQAHFGTVSLLLDKGSMPVYQGTDLSLEMAETQKILGTFRDGYGNNRFTYHPEYHTPYSTDLVGIDESIIDSFNSSEYRDTYVGSEAAKYPPLYYRYLSLYTWMVNSRDLITRLYVARIGGLDIVFVMAIVVYQIGHLIFRKKIYARTLTFLVMLQPMMSFVTAGVNSDNLHNLWFMLVIYLSLLLIERGIKFKYLLLLALVIALDIYTKPQGFIAIPVAVIALVMAVIRYKQWKLLIYSLLLGVVVLLLGYEQWEKYRHLLNVANNQGAQFIEYLRFSANKLLAQNVVWYWGVFKWLGVVLPPIYWRVMNRVVLLSVVGLLIYFWRVIIKKKVISDPFITLYLLLATIVYALIIFWYDWQHTKITGYSLGIQARYFFPTIVAHIALLMTGIISLGWTPKLRKWLRLSLVLLFLWLQLGGIWRIISIYYPALSLEGIIIQASQYKPDFAKGNWWYLWGSIYLYSLYYLVNKTMSATSKITKKSKLS